LEERLPISVSTGHTKSAREVFTVHKKALRERSELTKEEKHKERSVKKRKIKAMQKGKLINKKEHFRNEGL
jgi:glutamate mutase epsilon subunit